MPADAENAGFPAHRRVGAALNCRTKANAERDAADLTDPELLGFNRFSNDCLHSHIQKHNS
jgi:hypothetical protein